jgi:hypothetical protein
MKRWIAPIVVLGLVGCRGPEQYSAPAPAGSVACAVREAEQMGYRRLEGGEERGSVRVGRYIAPPPAREPTDPAVRLSDRQGPRLSDGPFESQLRISERDGSLRIAILSEARSPGGAPDPGGPAGDARQILVRCMTQPSA